MITGFKFLAFLSFYVVSNFHLGFVSAADLQVTLLLAKLSDQYTARFNVGGCEYRGITFRATTNGGVPSDGLSGSIPSCDGSVPEGAPTAIYLTGSPSLSDLLFFTSDSFYPFHSCTQSGNTPRGAIFDCDPIVPVIRTTTTTTTTSTTTTTTSTTTTTTTTTSPTTTTTTTTTLSSTSPTSIPTCAMKANIHGRKNGRGILKDCCKTSDDCYGSCKRGICDSEHNPTTTTSKNTSSTTAATSSPTSTGPCKNKSNVNSQKKGNGILGDCCRNSDDCTGTCIKGKCDADGNPSSGENCISSNYYGKKNGQGPAGVCCKTEKDCKNSCVVGKCIK